MRAARRRNPSSPSKHPNSLPPRSYRLKENVRFMSKQKLKCWMFLPEAEICKPVVPLPKTILMKRVIQAHLMVIQLKEVKSALVELVPSLN